MEDKLAIILSGGGMKCGWGAGIMRGLVDHPKFNLREPDILIGCSGSAGTGLGYIAGQHDSLYNAWTNTLSKKKILESFISWGWKGSSLKDVFNVLKKEKWKDCLPKKRIFDFFDSNEWKTYSKREIVNLFRFWKIIDVDYLVDEIFKNQKPELDLDKVYSSRTKFLIPVLDTKTGKYGYFSNRDEYFSIKDREGIIDAVKASMKIPIASGFSPVNILKSINPWSESSVAAGLKSEVKVKNGTYCDSILTSSAYTHVKKAVNEGAKKILIIDHDISKSRFIDRERILFNRWLKSKDKKFQNNYHRCEKRIDSYVCPSDVQMYTLELPRSLIGTLDNNENLLKGAFEAGYELVKKDKGLFRFLKWN